MKKSYSIFLFFLLIVAQSNLSAQIVNIPDANFKNKLIALGVDTNGDSQIQLSEASMVTSMNVNNSGIADITGIESFTNLDTLICSNNQFASLDVSNLTNLTYLNYSYNSIINVDVSNLTNLKRLECFSCGIYPTVDVSNNPNLTYLNCGQNYFGSLDVTNNPNLTHLNCSQNQFPSLDLSNNSNLTYLNCYFDNYLANLDVSNMPNLTFLNCAISGGSTINVTNNPNLSYFVCGHGNFTGVDLTNNTNLATFICMNGFIPNIDLSQNANLTTLSLVNVYDLTSIDLSNNPNLTDLSLSSVYQLNSLDLSNNPNLTTLTVANMTFPNLDISNNPNLTTLRCYDNPFTSLDLSNNPNLTNLYCYDNQLTSLDVSNCPLLDTINCSGNPGLLTLFLKNNKKEGINITNCPSIQYICADTSQIAEVQQKTIQNGLIGVVINSFCYYASGGNYNTISGQIFLDADANGCSPSDIEYPYLLMKVVNGTNANFTSTNNAGVYTAFADSGSYAITPQLQNYSYFSSSPSTANVYFPNTNNNTQAQDFCITATSVFPDVEIAIIDASGAPRPGFNTNYKLYIHNEGTNTASGNVTLDFMGNKMNVISTSLPPATQTSNQLTWAYSNLLPLQAQIIDVTMNILPSPTNNIGDALGMIVTVSLLNDADTSDNKMSLKETVQAAIDPNDKRCLEGDSLPNTQIGHFLHYLVRFQNTGNYYAENVVVVDTLDASKYDIASLQILDASHQTHVDVINNTLQFYFEGIMLPDSFSNEPASHGYVLFKIKTKNTMPFNSSVSNKVEIYFDYNEAVVTNTASTFFYSHCVPGFTSTANTQDVSCNGLCDGIISANVSGGTLPYTYLLNYNPTTANTNTLCAGNYIQTVIDSGGCFLTNTYTINTPTAINIAMNITNPILCYGENATIISTVNGGISPYQFDWGNGNTTSTANLPAGTYSMIVTDSTGCTTTNTISISQPTQLNAAVSGVTGTVNNMNGAIQITVSGATSPYTYSWSNGQTTQNANNLSTGIYSVTITDANSCDTTISNIEVTEIVGLEDSREILFNVYPNPSQTILNIETSETMDIAVYNPLGEVILSKRIKGKDHIDVSQLSKGVYWIIGNGKGLVFVKE